MCTPVVFITVNVSVIAVIFDPLQRHYCQAKWQVHTSRRPCTWHLGLVTMMTATVILDARRTTKVKCHTTDGWHNVPTEFNWDIFYDSVDSCPVDRCPVDSCPVDSCPVDRCPVDNWPVDNWPVDSCPVDSYPVDCCPVDTCPLTNNITLM